MPDGAQQVLLFKKKKKELNKNTQNKTVCRNYFKYNPVHLSDNR